LIRATGRGALAGSDECADPERKLVARYVKFRQGSAPVGYSHAAAEKIRNQQNSPAPDPVNDRACSQLHYEAAIARTFDVSIARIPFEHTQLLELPGIFTQHIVFPKLLATPMPFSPLCAFVGVNR
jgi:hypothetical protein